MSIFPKWDQRSKAQAEAARLKVLDAVRAKPGLQSKELHLNRRHLLSRLEREGLIVYRDGGWYLK